MLDRRNIFGHAGNYMKDVIDPNMLYWFKFWWNVKCIESTQCSKFQAEEITLLVYLPGIQNRT